MLATLGQANALTKFLIEKLASRTRRFKQKLLKERAVISAVCILRHSNYPAG
jgi:hypothetical protein